MRKVVDFSNLNSAGTNWKEIQEFLLRSFGEELVDQDPDCHDVERIRYLQRLVRKHLSLLTEANRSERSGANPAAESSNLQRRLDELSEDLEAYSRSEGLRYHVKIVEFPTYLHKDDKIEGKLLKKLLLDRAGIKAKQKLRATEKELGQAREANNYNMIRAAEKKVTSANEIVKSVPTRYERLTAQPELFKEARELKWGNKTIKVIEVPEYTSLRQFIYTALTQALISGEVFKVIRCRECGRFSTAEKPMKKLFCDSVCRTNFNNKRADRKETIKKQRRTKRKRARRKNM